MSSVEVGDPRLSTVTIKLVGAVPDVQAVPELAEHVGRYLTRYEPSRALENEQWLWTTDDRSKAARLPFAEAMQWIQTPIGIRQDGLPDRPISIFHIEIARG